MDQKTKPLSERRAWSALVAHYQKVRKLHLRKLFADDSTRGERMTAEAVGLFLDYSKNKQLAQRIIPEIESKERPPLTHDSSTNNLIYQYRKFKQSN